MLGRYLLNIHYHHYHIVTKQTIALKLSGGLCSIILHSYVIHNVGAGTNAGINLAAATVADARVIAKEVERDFVPDGWKKTYHEKLAQFTLHLLYNSPEYLADGHRKELQQKDEADRRMNAPTKT